VANKRTNTGMFSAVVNSAIVVAAVTVVASGCNSGSPTEPQPQPVTPREVSGTISFANAGPANAPISSHSESGFVVQFRSGTWEVWTNYGNPAPFPIFVSPRGAGGIGEIRITAGGAVFSFKSVDLYSSLTPIPYVAVGTRAAAKEVEFGDTLPAVGVVGNTFGAFRTVMNPSTGRLVDTLTLTLTNPAPPFSDNPMGLDNIVLGR
jgi:hypothetical protein